MINIASDRGIIPKTRRVIDVTVPTPVADDTYHAIILGRPTLGSFLYSLEEFSGKEPVDCRFIIPGLGEITIPGLNTSLFDARPVTASDSTGRVLPVKLLRLPAIYVMLNQALLAATNDGTRNAGASWEGFETGVSVYDWSRTIRDLRHACNELLMRLIEKRALRVREGTGFMALAQANPNLTRYEVGIGLELAAEILREIQRHEIRIYGKTTGTFEMVSDLAGLPLSSFMRFPATTSKSVRLDTHLVLSGRGRCVYVHPGILKLEMEGDVDGDLLFAEIESRLRRKAVLTKYVPIPDQVTMDNLVTDCVMGHWEDLKPADYYAVYEGMAGKDGIGATTNLFYRGLVVVHSTFQGTREQRDTFWSMVNRNDLRTEMERWEGDEAMAQRKFRHYSALVLMDAFHPLYEAIFDLRKNQDLRPILEQFLAAIRGQQPMNFEALSTITCKGKPVDVSAIVVLWNYAVWRGDIGKPAQYVKQFPIQNLFFSGRGVNRLKISRLGEILPLLPKEDPATFFFDEVAGRSYTKLSGEPEDITNAYEFGDGVSDLGQATDDYLIRNEE